MDHHPSYYWQTAPAAGSAQLLTLVCSSCGKSASAADIPLVGVLRDTLGDNDPTNDRLSYVWLLTHTRANIGRRLLAGVPFFYWRVGRGSTTVASGNIKPLMDLSAPQHPMLARMRRDLLQWTMLDPMTTAVRATSRAYGINSADGERLQLEQAIDYLKRAPTGSSSAELSAAELDTLIARLELRKRLLGGLVTGPRAVRFGEQQEFENERIRSRNWELLRQCAEKTGLVFEPLEIAGKEGEYAMLWFPLEGGQQPVGTALAPVWKLLNVKNPWTDRRLKHWHGTTAVRYLDENGVLLPKGNGATRGVKVIPLGLYSMEYPKLPLLLVDFRDKLHIRRHELAQRSINQITTGVIGLSHFTNWYYYAGVDLYDFVVTRHGGALDQQSRLDCYSQFRADITLDTQLDPALRSELQQRLDSLAVNPLEATPQAEVQVAVAQYHVLQKDAEAEGSLEKRLDAQRRTELAEFGQTGKRRFAEALLHNVTFGAYTPRAKRSDENLAMLNRNRRVVADLDFLESVDEAGTPPEIAYDVNRISSSVQELSMLLPQLRSTKIQSRAAAALSRLNAISQDASLRADCLLGLERIDNTRAALRTNRQSGVVAKPRTVSTSAGALLQSAQ
ncbi:MAG: hypothetical protein JOZ62_14900 [Acidobacteriaceae bacterium]|nr:hypothetical protein [Acidobacteriaceae bacterium]